MYEVLAFIRRHVIVLVVPAIALPVLTVLFVLLVLPAEYQARATIAIVPPKVSSELTPPSLTVQGYQQLLESDAVIAEAKRRLVEGGLLKTSDPLRLGKEIGSRIFVSRKAEDVSLAPMLDAIAWSDDPKLASAVANTWTQVFLEQMRSLISGSTSPQVAFVESEFGQVRGRLSAVEDQRDDVETDFRKRHMEAADRWQQRLADYTSTTDRQQAEFDAETRRLKETFLGERDLETRQAQLKSLRTAYSDLQLEQARVSAQLERLRLQLAAAERQLAETPQFLELRKAITDDALWAEVAPTGVDGRVDWDALKDRVLVTEIVNPVNAELRSKESQFSMEVDSLEPRKQQLELELKELSDRIKHLDSGVRGDDAELEGLEREREAGRSALVTQREAGRMELERARDDELDRINRTMQTRVDQLQREVQQQQDLFEKLASSFNEATLAKGQDEIEDLRLAAEAIPPDRPEPRQIPLRAAVALLLGVLAGAIIALWREILPRDHTSGPAHLKLRSLE